MCVLGRSLAEKTGGQSWCPEHSRPWEGQGADRGLTVRWDEGSLLWPSRVQCFCQAQKHSVWGPVQEFGGHQMARAQRSAVRPALGARGPGPQSRPSHCSLFTVGRQLAVWLRCSPGWAASLGPQGDPALRQMAYFYVDPCGVLQAGLGPCPCWEEAKTRAGRVPGRLVPQGLTVRTRGAYIRTPIRAPAWREPEGLCARGRGRAPWTTSARPAPSDACQVMERDKEYKL